MIHRKSGLWLLELFRICWLEYNAKTLMFFFFPGIIYSIPATILTVIFLLFHGRLTVYVNFKNWALYFNISYLTLQVFLTIDIFQQNQSPSISFTFSFYYYSVCGVILSLMFVPIQFFYIIYIFQSSQYNNRQ